MNSFDLTIQASPSLTTTEIVSKNYATIGDKLTYTLSITNNGPVDVLSLIVTDLIPQGANFETNTVKINGTTQSGVDPALGITVGTIPNGSTSTIVLNAIVITTPWSGSLVNYSQLDYQYIDTSTTVNPVLASVDSNSVVTTINSVQMSNQKSVNTNVLTGIGQTLTYTVKLDNGGSTTALNLKFIDTVPAGTSFVPGSVSVLGSPQPSLTVEPPTGLNFGNLPSNYYTTISFQVVVNTVPVSGSITNTGDALFDYIIDPTSGVITHGSVTSNSVATSSLAPNLSGISKYVNKRYATVDDILTYVITIPNSGNATAVNVYVVDTIPSGTTYLSNTMYVNGIPSVDLPTHINVGTIVAGALATIQFQVKVN